MADTIVLSYCLFEGHYERIELNEIDTSEKDGKEDKLEKEAKKWNKFAFTSNQKSTITFHKAYLYNYHLLEDTYQSIPTPPPEV